MPNGLIAVIIIIFVVIGAVVTRRCIEFLLLGSAVGSIILYGSAFPGKWIGILQEVVGDPDNVWLWLVCGLFGSLIAVLQAAGGTGGFSRILSRVCTNQNRTMLASYILGLLIFVDDYLNVLTVGVCMRDLYDQKKLPRESLAFVLDSTGAPVCVLLPFSTWAVFYAGLFYNHDLIAGQFSSGINAYIHAIPYCFYPMIALLIVLLFTIGRFPKLGAMKKAFERVEKTGAVYSAASAKYNTERDPARGLSEANTQNRADGTKDPDWNLAGDSERTAAEAMKTGKLRDFLIPIIALVAMAVITGDLLLSVITVLILCAVMYLPARRMTMEQFTENMIKGFGEMLPVFFMLVGAFSLAHICGEMQLTEYLIELAKPFLTPAMFPAVSFVLLSLLAFVTGSNWGMSAVVIPILIPMCAAIGGTPVLTMAAIISGGAFGSHACFYTDATILSSNAAGIDNMEHAVSQIPYVMIAAGISVILYLIAGRAI